MNRILVTGAGGYIGQHLCLALAGSGMKVRGFSRSPRPPHLDKIEWMTGDVTDIQMVARAVTGCSIIIHLACLSLGASAQNPLEAQRINSGGTLQLLEAARQVGVVRLIYTSTGQLYGGQAALPNVETHLLQPDSAYAASKLGGEVWADTYARLYSLSVQTLRLFNVYGSAVDKQPRPTVEAIFLRQLQQGQRPQVRGNPHSGRDFIHIQDVIRAIQLALVNPAWSGAINIGSGVLTPLVELAQQAAQVLGQTTEPEIITNNDPPIRFQADTTRAQTLLGFQAEIPLEVGLRRLAKDL
jgi:UDP-glucose 4-epimerase